MSQSTSRESIALIQKSLLEIKRLKAALAQSRKATPSKSAVTDIAVIGLGCRYPGGIETPEAFWDFLQRAQCAREEIPSARWDLERYYDAERRGGGRSYVRDGYFVDCIDGFDAEFFGISPAEAAALDPQHRLLLETSWHALEDAGISARALHGANVGTFVGVMNNDYAQHLIANPANIGTYSAVANGHGMGAARIAHNFGFCGPAMSVDTLCSSSLVGVHLAVQSLRAGECDLALVAGANLLVTPVMFGITSAAGMLSPDGRCKAFDESADGYARGEGVGVLVLKPLDAAWRDGDRIYATICGSAINQDGASSAISVPNGTAQTRVVQSALANAGLAPSEVDYVEAHGTGTALGDPIEAYALAAAYGSGRGPDAPLLIGSAKSNFGHTEGAAGITGLLKTILAIYHGRIPAHLHIDKLTSRIDWARVPLQVATRNRPWPNRSRRIAGVSSFGMGGTNAHVILRQFDAGPYPPSVRDPFARDPAHVDLSLDGPVPDESAQIDPEQAKAMPTRKVGLALTLSARTKPALATLLTQTMACLKAGQDDPSSIAAICQTSNLSRADLPLRLAFTASKGTELLSRIAAFDLNAVPSERVGNKRLAYILAGEYADLSVRLAAMQGDGHLKAMVQECIAATTDARVVAILQQMSRMSEIDDAFPRANRLLTALVTELAMVRGLRGAEGANSAFIGFGGGEIAAAYLAGCLTLDEAMSLATALDRLWAELPMQSGVSLDIAMPGKLIQTLLRETGLDRQGARILASLGRAQTRVWCPDTVMPGVAQLELDHRLDILFRTETHLPDTAAVRLAAPRFADATQQIVPKKARRRVVSGQTGKSLDGDTMSPEHWLGLLTGRQRLYDALATAAKAGCDAFLDSGMPGSWTASIASSLTELSPTDQVCWTSLKPEARGLGLAEVLGELWQAGLQVNWRAWHEGDLLKRASLPVYPFERRRYWIGDDALPTLAEETARLPHADVAAQQIMDLIAKVRGIEAHTIRPEARFQADLGFDSMMIMELKAQIERSFGGDRTITMERIMTITTVAELITFIRAD